MDREDRERNLHYVRQLRAALGLPPRKAVKPEGCQHERTAVTRYQKKNGSFSWVEMCIEDGAVVRFGMSTHAAQVRALELSPTVQDYVPNPELAEGLTLCSINGCDRLATMLHHLKPEHIFGQVKSRDGGTIPVCADHHAMLHRDMGEGADG